VGGSGTIVATGGSGGFAGEATTPPDAGAAGADDGCRTGGGCPFDEGVGIRTLASDATHLYWLEYGTEDDLHNYQHDGRLRVRAFDAADATTLASDLDGPIGMTVTAEHVYLYLDAGSGYLEAGGGAPAAAGLFRVPVAGGELELILAGASMRTLTGGGCETGCIAGGSGRDFFTNQGVIYSVATEAGSSAEILDDAQEAERVAVDDTHLYFSTLPTGFTEDALRRMPLAGGASVELGTFGTLNFAVAGDYLYTVELRVEGTSAHGPYIGYIARMPKDGSDEWTRIAKLGESAGHFAIKAGRYWAEAWDDGGTEQLVSGLIATPAEVTSVATVGAGAVLWIGAPVGAFWLDSGTIRLAPFASH
jgi:hypothetical protein